MEVHPGLTAAFIALYVGAQIAISLWASRGVKTDTDYFVGGRSVGVIAVTLSLFATWFGAETVMGSSAAIAQDGLSGGRAEPIGYALCLVAMAFIVAGAYRRRGYVTLADFYKDRFGRDSEVFAAIITAIVSTIWAAAQLLALAAILHTALGMHPQATLLIATVIIVAYTSFSGIVGDIATDVVQGMVVLVGLVLLLLALAERFGGFGGLFEAIQPEQLQLVPVDPDTGEREGWLARLDVFAIPILGSLVTQEAIARLMSTRSEQDARKAALGAAGLYFAVGCVPLLIALGGAHLTVPGWGGDDDSFLPKLAALLLHPLAYLIFLSALVSAILSTVNSNLLSVSSLTSVNILSRVHQGATEREKLRVARWTTIGAGIVALAIAWEAGSIYGLIALTSVFGQSGLLVAFLFGVYSRFGRARAALAAILAGVAFNLWSLILWPMAHLLQEGLGLGAGLLAIANEEGPAIEGSFLFSIGISLLAYIAVALWERQRPANPT
jgi:SSS family transporter